MENCYHTENSATDRRILARLEKELQAAFLFKDGEGQPISSLWVVCILLARLIRERTTLGHTIKQFAKFQRREIMRGMVKLNDLEDLAEPPLDGGPKSSSLTPR